jgi:hypothetical protein
VIEAFADRGGHVLFLPPREPDAAEFLGVRWGDWVEEEAALAIESWRSDQDLLANTQSGAALPVGQLQVYRFCGIAGELTPLAALKGGWPLIGRVPTPRGGVYFCATTPATGDSSLATEGVVLYVLIQRALAAGAVLLGNTRQLVAGDAATEQTTAWHQLAGPPHAISTDFAYHRGVYSAGDRLLAVNRSAAEDDAAVLADHRVGALFQGLDFTRVDGQAGSLGALIQEIWRLFLGAMIVALMIEAALCLPKVVRPAEPAPAGVSDRAFGTEHRPAARAIEFADSTT